MQVKELMTTDVSCVRPDATIINVAKQMRRENIGSLPICNDKGEILGIITDRDMVIRSLASDSVKITAGDIMSTNIVTVAPEMNIHDAAILFSKHQVRRLPVTSSGKLVGIIAMADLARRTLLIDEAGDALSAISKN